MQKIAVREAIWILLGIIVIVVLMTIADSETGLPNCPEHKTTQTRCAP